MEQLLIVWIVRIIILENKIFFWVIYANSNTFHVETFFRFESMQKLSKFKFKRNSKSYQIENSEMFGLRANNESLEPAGGSSRN